MKYVNVAKFGAVMLGLRILTSGGAAFAQDAAGSEQAAGGVEIENFSMRGLETDWPGEKEQTFNFRVYRDACGIHYTIDGKEYSESFYEEFKRNLMAHGILSGISSARLSLYKRDRMFYDLQSIGAFFGTTISIISADDRGEFAHYKVNDRHIYFVDGKPATEQEFNARVARINNRAQLPVAITPQHVH